MKNICIFTNTLYSGGAEKQAVLLAKSLKPKFNVVVVVYYGQQVEEKFTKILRTENIKIILLSGNHYSRCFSFYNLLRHQRIDIVFSYLLTTNIINGIISKLAGVKYRIGGIRSSKLDSKKIILQKILQNYINYYTIYNNHKGFHDLTLLGFKKNKATVIPNCFEIDTVPKKREIKEVITILSVGRFHIAKDYKTAIKAISRLRKFYSNFIYQIIGYGAEEDNIRNWITEFHVQDFVEIIINPDNLNAYYENADIYLMTSIFEGLSNTVLEAMSFSLPLILTNVGDNDKLVYNDENGFLCDVGNVNQIADRLGLLLNSYNQRIQYGVQSYKILKTNYSFEKFQKNYFKLIENLEK